MTGRITNGGFNMRSMPLSVAATGVGLAVSVGLAVGDGPVSGDGVGGGCGVGVAATACSVKLAHGFGGGLVGRWGESGGAPVGGCPCGWELTRESAAAAAV